VLFVVSGLVTALSTLLPSSPDLNHGMVVVIGIVAGAEGLVLAGLPWRRLPTWTCAAIVVPSAFALIAVHNYNGGLDPFRYSMFYPVVFVWIGLTQRRWASLAVSPLLVVSYLAPLVLRHQPGWTLASSVMVVPVMVLIGEAIAWVAASAVSTKAELLRLAGTDVLTGLDNRATFYQQLGLAWEEEASSSGRVAVFFVDLDGFKDVNDAYGHEAGDQLLAALAGRLRASARRSDRVARLGGDEFAVLAPGIADGVEAELVARRIVEELRRPLEIGGVTVVPSASVGFALAASDAADPDELIRQSDLAMYSAKQSGGGRFSCYQQVRRPAGSGGPATTPDVPLRTS
jgi:diguanylate cyclase (GGDEF)-like protein